jgi:hypothetical protein
MEVQWLVQGNGAYRVHRLCSTYDEASKVARRTAEEGITAIISKVIPCARFVAKVTVDVQEDEALCEA